jgi:hypothetical protein
MWGAVIQFAAQLGLWILNKANANEAAKKKFLEFIDYAIKRGWVNSVKLKEEWEQMIKDLDNGRSTK